MPRKMGGKCSGASQNSSKVIRPTREQVRAIWHVQGRQMAPAGSDSSSGTRQKKILVFDRGADCEQKPPPAKTHTVCPVHPGKVKL